MGNSLLNNTIKDRRYPKTSLTTIWLADVDTPNGKRLIMTLPNNFNNLIANYLEVPNKLIDGNPINACGTFIAG
ncbi:hypothetical protein MJO52_05015 [Microbulbifer variabilis]|uniref:Uncharacterized protein n=1 Tax=Microbulbifer variabilis TaxID=266805 RepID=A0ABY4VH58_9GAMM|nr:hypothetical protein [Microbulbifer variabilis]USD22493.1 hypothetical protein MJO52_05015 [Microbulbifer variabilis]